MLRHHTASFRNALEGIIWVARTEKHFKIHLFFSACAVFLGAVLQIRYFEFIVVLLLVVVGLAIEMLNTAIEEATDAIDTKWRQDLKIAKDAAAGAMLIFSIGSLVIAGIIFVPYIIVLL